MNKREKAIEAFRTIVNNWLPAEDNMLKDEWRKLWQTIDIVEDYLIDGEKGS
jgi:hypothetical protein